MNRSYSSEPPFYSPENLPKNYHVTEEIASSITFRRSKDKKPHHIRADEQNAQITAQVEAQVEAQVDSRILHACAQNPLSSTEIAHKLGHKTLSGNVRQALPALREAGFLEYTIPDKPQS